MARDITSGFQAEIEADSLKPCLIVKAEFDSGDLTLWSGYGDMVFDGQSYQGAGDLIAMSRVDETQDLKANNMNFELSGIPSSLVAIAHTEHYQGRPVTAWFGVIDGLTLVADPYKVFSGQLDVMETEDDEDNSRIGVSAESDLIDLRVKKERRYTPEDQKIEYPGDKGFDFIPVIQDLVITWGAGRED